MTTFAVSVQDRAFAPKAHGLPLSVVRYGHHRDGGPDTATLEVAGKFPELWQLADWLRYGITIYGGAQPFWWGFVQQVTFSLPGFEIGLSLDSMSNKVAVAYNRVVVGSFSVGERVTTPWATDANSVAEYGTKELLAGAADASDTQAAQLRDTMLSERGNPSPVLLFGETDMPRVTIECRGWWHALNWLHYATDGEPFEAVQALGSETQIFSLAALGDNIAVAGTYPNGSIYRSADNGGTWSLIGQLGSETHVPSLAYGTDNTVIAGTQPNGSIYQSTDAGVNWSLIGRLDSQTSVAALLHLGGKSYLAGTTPNGKIYKSTDAGATWTLQATLSTGDIYSFCYMGEDIVLVGTGGGGSGKIYKSTDAGATWTDKGQLGLETYVTALVKVGPGSVLAGTVPTGQIYSSTDFGETWALVTRLGTETDVRSLLAYNENVVLAGTHAGGKIYKSGDQGETWAELQSLGIASVLALAELAGGVVVAGTANGGQIFANTATVETTTQISAMYADYVATNPLLTSMDMQTASGVFSAEYRDGETTHMAEILALLEAGNTANRPLQAAITPERAFSVVAQPGAGDVRYYLSNTGDLLDRHGNKLAGACPVGAWCGLRDLGYTESTVFLASLTPFLILRCDYDVKNKKYTLEPQGQVSPWALAGVL